MIAGSRALASADHQGKSGCELLHKVVEFDLPAAQGLVLQLGGRDDALVELAITGPIERPATSVSSGR